MANKTEYSRLVLKRTAIAGVVPTVNTGSTIDSNWLSTDILSGEMFANIEDDRIFYRTNNGIVELASAAYTGQTNQYLPLAGGTMDSGAELIYGSSSGITGSLVWSVNSNLTGNRSVILGGQNITGTADDTVYVPTLNIGNVVAGTSINNLGVDVNGNVIIGTPGSGETINTFVSGATMNGNTLELSRTEGASDVTVDLSQFVDDTNDGVVSGATLNGNTLELGRTQGLSTLTTDLSQFDDSGLYLPLSGGTLTGNLIINASLGIGKTPRFPLDVATTTGEFFVRETVVGVQAIMSGATTGLTQVGIISGVDIGGTIGMRGFNDATYTGYGAPGDMFMYSGNDQNGLNLISQPGTGMEDYIRFFAGQAAGGGGTPDLHIQGSGSTKGNISIGHGVPTEKLDVLGSIKMVDGNETNGYVMTCDANGVGSWQVTSATGATASGDYLPLTGGTVTGDVTVDTDVYARTVTILNSGATVSSITDLDSNTIDTGVWNSTIIAGSGNTIPTGLSNVLVGGVDISANTSNTAYFTNLNVGGVSITGDDIYTTGATFDGASILFDRTDLSEAYQVNISSITDDFLPLVGGELSGPLTGTTMFLTDTTGTATVYLGKDALGQIVGAEDPLKLTGGILSGSLSGTSLHLSDTTGGSSTGYIGIDTAGQLVGAATPQTLTASGSIAIISDVITLTGTPITESFAISDETTQIVSGSTAKLTWYAPYAMTITEVKGSISESGSTFTKMDIHLNGTTIFGADKVVIDINEHKSVDAGTGPNLTTTAVGEDDKLELFIDNAGVGALGAKLYIIGTRTN